jgi:hypothetical protein
MTNSTTPPAVDQFFNIVEMLAEVAKAAHYLCEDSMENEHGAIVADEKSWETLSKKLDQLDTLPEIDDGYVRDGWLRALKHLQHLRIVGYAVKWQDGKIEQRGPYLEAAQQYADAWNAGVENNKARVIEVYAYDPVIVPDKATSE